MEPDRKQLTFVVDNKMNTVLEALSEATDKSVAKVLRHLIAESESYKDAVKQLGL